MWQACWPENRQKMEKKACMLVLQSPCQASLGAGHTLDVITRLLNWHMQQALLLQVKKLYVCDSK
jgi:hypothetical protein